VVGVPSRTTRDIHLRFLHSRSRRAAVRRFAATSEALRARAKRSFGVNIAADFFPPFLPNLRAISAIAALTSGKSHGLQGGVRLKVASACSSRSFVKLNATEFGPYAGTAAAEPFTAGSVARCGFFAISSAPRATTSSMAAA
jgi:hypothetical protein